MKFTISVVSVFLGGVLTRCSASESFSQLRRGDGGRDLAEYDCSVGCPAGNGNPVCSEGITFQHECYAYCQGMTSILPGSCPGDPGIGFFSSPGSRLLSNPGIITQFQMNMYEEDGFLFVGNVEIDEESRPPTLGPFDNPEVDENGNPIGSDEDFGDKPHTAIRVTYDEGLGYVSRVFYPNDLASDSSDQSSTGKKGGKSGNTAKKGSGKKGASKENKAKRARGKKGKESNALKEVNFGGGDFDFNEESIIGEDVNFDGSYFDFNEESIIGDDTRSEVQDTTDDPYNKITEIDYGSGEGGCSGVVVGTNSIITAAHCVYNRSQRRWHPVHKTAPGRYRDDGRSEEPYGTWRARDATLYGRWAYDGEITHDVAVVRFRTSSGLGIGERVGTVELVDHSCDVAAMREAHITGYPADVPNGQQTTSGRCEAWRHSPCDSLRVFHKCDTKGGNSGSPMLDEDGDSFGCHTHGGSSWNSGVMFTRTHINVLNNWID